MTLACLVALTGCGLGATQQKAVSPTPTWAAAAGAPGVTTAKTPGWSQYRDPTYGYVVEFPSSSATISPATGQSGTTSVGWRFANQQGSADMATLAVTTTTHGSAGLCANVTHGKPTSLSGGVTAYETDNLSATGSVASQPQIAIIFTHDGLLTIISLTGQGSADAFEQHWGGIWGHILATFQPGKSPTAGQPCA